MDELRCPMCSKVNPPDASVCEFCGARLKPLIAGQEPEGAPADREGAFYPDEVQAEGEASTAPDWLSRIRSEATKEQEAEPEPGATEASEAAEEPDWLGRLRPLKAEDEEGPPPGEIPEWLAEPSQELPTGAEAEVPEWLARIRERQKAESQAAQELPPEPTDDWLGRLRGSETPSPEEAPALEPEGIESAPEPAPEEDLFGDAEDWLKQGLEAGPTPQEAPSGIGEEIIPRSLWEAATQEFEEPEPISTPQDQAPEEPDWFVKASTPPDDDLPHVPALITDDSAEFLDTGPQDVDLDAIDLPDWLSELKGPPSQAKAAPEAPGDRLAPATLPAWLEAMRPMETFRPVVEIQPEDEQAIEAVGPLAGLRGVLLAEPVVAMPRGPTISAGRLDVTERHFALSELLHRLVQEEELELPAPRKARRRLPLVRWAIALFMLLAVVVTLLTASPSTSVPTASLPDPDVDSLIPLVNQLPLERPVLLVFDYEPAFSGELNTVAGPLLDHLMVRGLRLATVSTKPSGPPLAERLVHQLGNAHQYENGKDYIHLGYLPGGQAAVQLFAQSPREASVSGFLLPEGLAAATVWDSPVLEGVQALSDFGCVVVIAAGTDVARTWIEQASPWMGQSPLVMVLTAGAEPLVRPYYEAAQPQVRGILTGMHAAVAYEQKNGGPDEARALWNAFGSGVMASEITLVLGGIYGLAAWFTRRGGR